MFNKELLEKIASVTKDIFFHNEVITFKTEKLKDSEQEVKYSELAVGSDVTISSAAGDEVAPDGQYDTDGGNSFIVVDCKISEIVSSTEPEKEPEELAVEEPVKEDEVEVVESTDNQLESKIAVLQDQLAALQAELEKEKSKESVSPSEFSGLKKDVLAIAELLSAMAKTPAEFSKTDERAEALDSQNQKNERLKHLANFISKK